MKSFIKRLKEFNIKFEFYGTTSQCFLLAVGLNLFVESMSRHSVWQAFLYFFTSPLVFLYNALIILVTLSVALFFKRRIFALSMISILWIMVGITDFTLLLFRTTPFTAVDILLLRSVISILPHYLSLYHYILSILLLLALILVSIRIFKRAPVVKEKLHFFRILTFITMITLSSFGLTHIGVWSGLLSENFGNLANAFHRYGLPYCFVNSIINTGIDKPKQYSKEVVGQIIASLDKGIVIDELKPTSAIDNNNGSITPASNVTPTPKPTPIPTKPPLEQTIIIPAKPGRKTPNIIMVQLESFFDPSTILGIEFTQDPLPHFRYLKERFTSGFLNVPSVGAGTANTEFEIITGMNLDFFGPGEYPYKTVLQSTTCESVNYNLKQLGYKTHAIHNNIATFYDRHIVFSQLGFDTFTSIEYMKVPRLTPLGWATDDMLTDEIRRAMESTDTPDFIYTISVQGHGAYPTTSLLENPAIDLTLPEGFSKETYYSLLYYINQIHEMDQFIEELISYLEQCGEDTVLVFYGDHLPGFSLTEDDLSNNSLFQTEYVMWSNFKLEAEHPELEAYQLYSYVLDRLDIHEGLIPKLHQTQKDSEIYLEQLKILEYDMLYGDLDCYGGINPYSPTNIKMGINNIYFHNYRTSVQNEEKSLYNLHIIGDWFNTYSKVCVNGVPTGNTKYESRNLLSISGIELKQGDKLTIAQIGEDGRILSFSNERFFNP